MRVFGLRFSVDWLWPFREKLSVSVPVFGSRKNVHDIGDVRELRCLLLGAVYVAETVLCPRVGGPMVLSTVANLCSPRFHGSEQMGLGGSIAYVQIRCRAERLGSFVYSQCER